MRIRVNINVSTQVKTNIFIKRENGSSLWVTFKYERLLDFCYRCGRLGHAQSNYHALPIPINGVADPRTTFGPWMRATPIGANRDLGQKSDPPCNTKDVGPLEVNIRFDFEGSPTSNTPEPSPKYLIPRNVCTQLRDISNLVPAQISANLPPCNLIKVDISNLTMNLLLHSSPSTQLTIPLIQPRTLRSSRALFSIP